MIREGLGTLFAHQDERLHTHLANTENHLLVICQMIKPSDIFDKLEANPYVHLRATESGGCDQNRLIDNNGQEIWSVQCLS